MTIQNDAYADGVKRAFISYFNEPRTREEFDALIPKLKENMGVKGPVEVVQPGLFDKHEHSPYIGVAEKHVQAAVPGGKPGTPAPAQRVWGIGGVQDNTAEAFLAHEMGHARNWEAMGLNPSNRHVPTLMAARNLTHLAGGLGGLGYSIASDDPSWGGVAAAGALQAPTLIDEGMASARATKHLVKQYGWKDGLKRSRGLLPAYATYAAPLAATAAVTGVRKYMKHRDEEKQKK